MRKISLWVIGMTMVIASATMLVVLAQTPTQPEVKTETPGRMADGARGARGERRGGRQGQHGDRLAKIDADRDGKISRTEWTRNAEVFAKLDANSDGFLTRDEMKAGRLNRGARGHRGFGRMDQNKDGQVTREEWKGPAEMFAR
ncbi:MAG: hypothetical protein ABI882_16390, partial [Acidobacteriota bacterium]